jgi:hypothetical protein
MNTLLIVGMSLCYIALGLFTVLLLRARIVHVRLLVIAGWPLVWVMLFFAALAFGAVDIQEFLSDEG